MGEDTSDNAQSAALDMMQEIPRDKGGPVFEEPWQAQAFAMAVALNQSGYFTWTQWAHLISKHIAKDGDPQSYYHHWLRALEEILIENNLLSADEHTARIRAWDEAARATPHGEPIVLE